ncbi:EAL domain-containing protein [Dapis sp. BLCC M172]|uniref:EAL domain-containing protein n=1 Tax=Dapis sp. BLCC M172 TaxID=2975281 RepID=UPI003CFB647E
MWQLIANIFSPGQFIPKGQCYLWNSGLIWLNASSDALIAIAYYSIAIILVYSLYQRQNISILGAFISFCGTTHLMEVWTLWHPAYWISVGIKGITAILSLYISIRFFSLIPLALTLPNPAKLKATNESLESEIQQCQKTQIALRKSETRYRAIVEDQTELICRFYQGGILTFVNDACCRYFDKTPEELIGISFYQFLTSVQVAKLQQQLDILTPEQPVATYEQMVEMESGERKWQEWTNRAIFDEYDNLVEYQGVGRDITAIRESERRFRAIFNQTFQFIGLLKPDGTILEANQTFLDFADAKHQDIIGKYFWEAQLWLAVDDDENSQDIETKYKVAQAQIREAIAKAAQGEFVRYEMMVVGKDHEVMTIDFSLKPVFDELGDVVLLIPEGRDITDRKYVEQKLSTFNTQLEQRVLEQTEQLKLANQALKNQVRLQRVIAELSQKALAGIDISVLMDEIVTIVAQTLDVEYSDILELRNDENAFLLRAGFGWREGVVGNLVLDVNSDSQASYTLRSSQPIIVEDLRKEERFRDNVLLNDYQVLSGISVIILDREKPFGIVGVYSKRRWWLSEDDVYFLQAVANLLATAIERRETEDALKSSEENFRQMAENIREIFWIASLDKSELMYISPGFEDIWGRSVKDLYEQVGRISDSIHPLDKDLFAASFEKQSRGEFTNDEYRIVRPDGEMRWIWTRAFPVRNESGEIYRTVGISEDITERKKMELALFQEKEKVQTTLKSIGDGVITTDKNGHVDYLNPMTEKMTGWELAAARGKPLTEILQIIDEVTGTPMENPVDIVFREQRIVSFANNIILVARDGQEYAIEDSAAPIKTEDNQILGAVLVFRDVTDKRKLTNQISWQAQHDSLTGLLNRREFEKYLDNCLVTVQEKNQEHTLAYIDLDRFKIVNDTCGHQAGDELLRQVSTLLNSVCRKSDIVARLGGDEFGLLLLQCTMNNAEELVQELIDRLQQFRFAWEGKSFNIGMSVGLVAINQESLNNSGEKDSNVLLSAADAACYIAKNQGRNCYHVYQTDDQDVPQQKNTLHWVTKIHQACEENLFCLYYQAVAPLSDSYLSKFYYEILLRLKDETGKIIPPMAFLPAAERYHLNPMIDRWVIKNFLKYLSEVKRQLQPSFTNKDDEIFLRQTPNNSGEVIYGINISGETVNDKEFITFLQEQFARFNISPQTVCFELTETVAMANLSQTALLIKQLKHLGCRFALDDFGGGVSSFTYLKNLPVDYLKIDGSFVKDIVNDPIDYAIVEGMNNISHVMGLETIAELVSDRGILDKVKAIGINYGQGYGVAYPQPLD